MFRNCLAAALRHLARNKLYTAISVLGLSVGLCTALLAALVIRNELGHDHFISGYDRIYMVVTSITPPDGATLYKESTNGFVGKQLALRFSEIQAMTRMRGGFASFAILSRPNIEAHEHAYWADPNAFEVLPLPVVAGDLKSALSRPDTIVISRSIARKYFGRDAPVGETLVEKFDGRPETAVLTVTAVIEDLPPNGTHLTAGIFLSSLAPWTQFYQMDHDPNNDRGDVVGTHTYLKLAPHASAGQVQQRLPAMEKSLWTGVPKGWALALKLVRMDRIDANPWVDPGFSSRLAMIIIVGFGILVIAGVNFVNLLTAHSALRAREVSVRKLAGAGRRVLVLQFLTESIAYVTAATMVAVAFTELLLPHVNAFLATGATFSYWQDPTLIAAIVLAALLLGTLGGAYPAFVLSAFRPLRILTGETRQSRGAGWLRQILVTGQFAILIGLIIAAAVVYQQRRFATQEALRVDADQMLLINSPCNRGFTSELRRLPGVRGVSCSTANLVDHGGINVWLLNDKVGVPQMMYRIVVEPSLFDLYGIKPVAGRTSGSAGSTDYVINETAARRLGFARPADAVGYEAPVYDAKPPHKVSVIGVIPDFSFDSVEHRIEAQAFNATPMDPGLNLINVKLTGHQIPETLSAIDRLWMATGPKTPISRVFLEERIQTMYLAMLREAELFGVFASIAVVLASLGLFGLAASIAQRRTREIGIRKALGAHTGNIFQLLLQQFAKPVLWANLIAWPVTAYAMHRWLAGFAYHVALAVWLFPAAAALTLLIALLTVSTHSILVARANPVAALRYE